MRSRNLVLSFLCISRAVSNHSAKAVEHFQPEDALSDVSLGAGLTVGAALASSAKIFRDLLSDENVSFFTARLSRNQNVFAKFAGLGGTIWDAQM